ncbi:MAG: iron-containing alcohol dehydrogenase [Akkermansia sp.]|nr:iron-containing alcohol dehydrogenase [Akkermansia sp.]
METGTSFDYQVPTRTVFGAGSLNRLHKESLPGRKALVVISNGKSTRANGYLDRTLEQLSLAGVEAVIFDKVQANPLKDTVMEGADAARTHACDFILALGGGSCMDAAKAMAIMATNPGDLWDYVLFGTGKRMPVEVPPLPLVAITTTAGTGSETDGGGVITNPETQEKTAVFDGLRLFPRLAVVDPELMCSVPPRFTAFQGFDALFHSTEGYISSKANLMSDMVSITAIENVGRYLAATVQNGQDLAARERVAFGNWLSGIQMVVGTCTSEHSLEHALSAFHQDLPHGAGLIMISRAYYTHFIRKGACPERFVRMAQALGMQDAAEPMDFITALVRLQEACGVADLKMSDYGISPDEFEATAQNAFSAMGFLFGADPLPLSVEDCVEIYRASYK